MGGFANDPVERILRLAAYLKSRRDSPVALDDIARDVPGYGGEALVPGTPSWETVRKRLHRDLDKLAAHWGVQVDYVEAEHRYELRPPFFSRDERAALIAAAATVDVDGPGDERPGEVGSAVDDRGAEVVVRVHDLVGALRDACASRTPVRFRHDGRHRTLWPYALGTWRNRWYVAGWDPDRSAIRRFRLDRIEMAEEAAILPAGESGSYEVPDWFRTELAFDFDPNAWGHDPLLQARVRVEADYVDLLAREFSGRVIDRTNEAAVVEFDVRHYQSTRDRLLAFGTHAVVIDPPQLVRVVRDHLSAIAASR